MSVLVFVDTNVLIYALDSADPGKQQAATEWREELWLSGRGRVSFQVLHEFYVKVTRMRPEARLHARAEVRDLLAWKPVVADEGTMNGAWSIQDRYQLSFWDALIVAAAKSASCAYLLTEDLQAGQSLEGVVVINPFRTKPSEIPS